MKTTQATPAPQTQPRSPAAPPVIQWVVPQRTQQVRWWQRQPRKPRTVPVENVRARIAYALLAIFAGTVAATFLIIASGWASADDVEKFEAPIVSAEVSLLGAVMGFYYASGRDMTPLGPPVKPNEDEDD